MPGPSGQSGASARVVQGTREGPAGIAVNVVADRLVARPALRAGLPILFIAPLWLLSFTTRVAASPALLDSFRAAAALLAAWYVAVLVAARAGRIALDC